MHSIVKYYEVAKQWYRVFGKLEPENSRYGLCYKFHFVTGSLDKVGDIKGIVFLPTTAVTFSNGYSYISKALLDQKLKEKGATAADALGRQYEIVNKIS